MKKTGDLAGALKKYAQPKKVLRVGFVEEATYPDGTPVAQVAFWNEYGTETAPSRPFFRKTIRDNQSGWVNRIGGLVKSNNADKALALLGEHISGQIVQTITTFAEPPNATSTIKKKGFDAPLRDTMQMARSVGYEVSDDES